MLLIKHPPPVRLRSLSSVLKIMVSHTDSCGHRPYSLQPLKRQNYEAVVVGAGPAGIAVVGNLLDHQVKPILWVDDEFQAGRLHKYYREVPSNTKVKFFNGYAEGVLPFQDIIEETEKPNAYTKLQEMDREKTCMIAQAADLCRMMTEGLDERKGVEKQLGRMEKASWNEKDHWTVQITPQDSANSSNAETRLMKGPLLVLCTGSHPITSPLPLDIKRLPLDPALKPSELRTMVPTTHPLTIAVIGASHSAILVLRNIYNLSRSSHSNVTIKWFTRHPLRYAEEKDGWILRDNTGLKGEVAVWAKENLEVGKLEGSDAGRVVRKVDTKGGKEVEDAVYKKELKGCEYVVQAIGYERNEIPKVEVEGKEVDLAYGHKTAGFGDGKGQVVRGLYGAGIAWPEQVVDPEGNVEYAVGLWKFMKYLKKVVRHWRA